jgi:hypothetical protein
MMDFEKLGAFYLGRRVADSSGEVTDDLVLYDSKASGPRWCSGRIIDSSSPAATGCPVGSAAKLRIPARPHTVKASPGEVTLTRKCRKRRPPPGGRTHCLSFSVSSA